MGYFSLYIYLANVTENLKKLKSMGNVVLNMCNNNDNSSNV